MPTYPQISSNLIITQLPYGVDLSFDTVSQDMDTGMRWSFPRRNGGLTGYPTGPLRRFGVNYTNITDSESDVLEAFFNSMRGKWGEFRFLDPSGNLLQYSEDFSQSYWNKSNGPVTVGSTGVSDPFGGSLATALIGGGTNAFAMAVAGPSDGGINGYRLCASAWVKTPDSGIQLVIGFRDSTGVVRGTTWNLPQNAWKRIYHSEIMWDANEFRMVLGGSSTWASGRTLNFFGVQVTSTKGEGAYAKSPDNWGYHQRCRFDTDSFERRVLGPNQNSVQLPIQEIYV